MLFLERFTHNKKEGINLLLYIDLLLKIKINLYSNLKSMIKIKFLPSLLIYNF